MHLKTAAKLPNTTLCAVTASWLLGHLALLMDHNTTQGVGESPLKTFPGARRGDSGKAGPSDSGQGPKASKLHLHNDRRRRPNALGSASKLPTRARNNSVDHQLLR